MCRALIVLESAVVLVVHSLEAHPLMSTDPGFSDCLGPSFVLLHPNRPWPGDLFLRRLVIQLNLPTSRILNVLVQLATPPYGPTASVSDVWYFIQPLTPTKRLGLLTSFGFFMFSSFLGTSGKSGYIMLTA